MANFYTKTQTCLEFLSPVEDTCRTFNTNKQSKCLSQVGFLDFQLQYGNKHTGLNNICILWLCVRPYLVLQKNRRSQKEVDAEKLRELPVSLRCFQDHSEIWDLEP